MADRDPVRPAALWRHLREIAADWLDRWFPERQALIRGPGHVSAIRLSRRLQLAVVSGAAAGVAWSIAATVGFGIEHHAAARLGRQVADLARTAHSAIEDAAADRARAAQAARDLDRRLGELNAATAQNAALRANLASVAELLETSHSERERVAATEDDLRGRLARTMIALFQAACHQDTLLAELLDIRERLVRSDAERDRATGQGRDAGRRIEALQQDLATAQGQAAALQKSLASRQAALDAAITERTKAEADRDQAQARAKDAVAQLEAATASSNQALTRLTMETRTTIDAVEKIVTSTGLDLNRLAPPRVPDRRNDRSLPRGGPFVPWANQAAARPPAVIEHSSAALSTDIERLQRLRDLLGRVPLSAPLAVVSVSSPFGYRVDPFNGRPALHEGIDLQGPRGMPVSATAPGVVVFAGWRPEYGRVVELDHGFGMRTRYAHLDEIRVVAGATVALHQPIGTLGATGRVSGAHLHYEVLVDGRVQNPLNFLKANNYVLQRD